MENKTPLTFAEAIDRLADTDNVLTELVLVALSGASTTQTEIFCAHVSHLGQERQRELVERMVRLSEARFDIDYDDLMICMLDWSDPVVRRLAVEGLWETERPKLMERLIAVARQDASAAVRAAAVMGLSRYVYAGECLEIEEARAERLRQVLEGFYHDPNEDLDVARRAVEALGYINDDAVVRIIQQAYDDDREPMRQSALFAMGRSADMRWAAIIMDEMAGDVPALRFEAVRAAGEIRLERAIPRLIRLCQDPDVEVSQAAIWSLGQIGGDRAVAALDHLAESDEPAIRTAVAQALEEAEFANLDMRLLDIDPEDVEMIVDEHDDDDSLDERVLDDDEDDYDDEDDASSAWPDAFLDLD